MRGLLLGLLLGLACVWVAETKANQYFPTQQVLRGWANNDWSFMTAWDLSTGALTQSPDWYNGEYLWRWTNVSYYHWIALFIYDDGSGRTQELTWYWIQPHVQ